MICNWTADITLWITYTLTIRKPETPQVRYWNSRTVVLDPDEGSSVRAGLLVRVARISWFACLVGQRKSDEHTFPRVFSSVVDIDWYADVKATGYPVLDLADSTRLVLPKPRWYDTIASISLRRGRHSNQIVAECMLALEHVVVVI